MLRWLLKKGAYTTCLKVVAMVITLLFVALLSQWMPKEDYGVLAMIVSIAAFAGAIGGFGQTDLVIRENSPLNQNGRFEDARRYLAQASGLTICVAVFPSLAVGGYFLADGYSLAVAISAFVIVLMWSLAYPLQGGARSEEKFLLALGPRDIFWRALVVAAGAALFYNGVVPSIELLAPLSAALLVLLVGYQMWSLNVSPWALASGPTAFQDKARLSASFALMLSATAITAQNTVDVFLVGAFMSPEAAAEYFPANRVALAAGLFFLPFQMLIGPRIATMMRKNNLAGVKRLNTLATFLLAAAVGASSLVLLIAYPLYAGAFETATATTRSALQILVVGQLANSLLGLPGVVLTMAGKQKQLANANIVVFVLGSAALFWAASSGSILTVALVATASVIARKVLVASLSAFYTGVWPIHPTMVLPARKMTS